MTSTAFVDSSITLSTTKCCCRQTIGAQCPCCPVCKLIGTAVPLPPWNTLLCPKKCADKVSGNKTISPFHVTREAVVCKLIGCLADAEWPDVQKKIPRQNTLYWGPRVRSAPKRRKAVATVVLRATAGPERMADSTMGMGSRYPMYP